MVYYDKIDVSGVIGINKAIACKECIICHYWYLWDREFKFQSSVCNSCDDILMMSIDINSIVILNICGIDYHCVIVGTNSLYAVKINLL